MTALARLARNAITISLTAVVIAMSLPAAEPPPSATTGRETAVIALDFPGGSWAEFAIALEKASGRRANLIMPQDVAIPVPAIRVNGAGLPQIFQAIRLVEPRLSIERVMGDHGGDPVYAVMLAREAAEPSIAGTPRWMQQTETLAREEIVHTVAIADIVRTPAEAPRAFVVRTRAGLFTPLSDEALLAALADRPPVLIGAPGERQLVLPPDSRSQ